MAHPSWLQALGSVFRRLRKTDVSLVEDEDLMALLSEIGKLDDLREGRLKCTYCEKVLSLENLSGFFVHNGQYHFLCDDRSCITKAGSQ